MNPDLVRAIDQTAAKLREELRQDTPVWGPLETAIPEDQLAGFMYMGSLDVVDGPRIFLYKHGITRRYLNLSADGRTWRYMGGGNTPGRYVPVTLADAVLHVFEGIESLGASPATRYDDEYRAARNRALSAAGWRVLEA